MVFPLEELVKYSGNIYAITVAASRRAYQMAKIEDPEIEQNDGKVVSLAARQVFDNKVTFKIEQQ
ncbi:MAG TPA: DNA-directed RNA polymerase subunit omega [Treponema sp.]|nr:DNA-directed RNA polymerase subunit omega [Treponema sp.]